MPVRPTLRCLREDLRLPVPPARTPLDQIGHPLLAKASEQFADPDTPHVRIRAVDDVVLFKVKVGRWRGAAFTDEPQDTLGRQRRTVGDDHPHTLMSASNMASVLHALGEHQAARDLAEDTLARQRRVLGDGHRYTLISMGNLARILHALGQHEAAREWNAFAKQQTRLLA